MQQGQSLEQLIRQLIMSDFSFCVCAVSSLVCMIVCCLKSLEDVALCHCFQPWRSCGLNLQSILTAHRRPCPTYFCLLSVPVSESWSRSKGQCSLVGQHSALSSVPLFPSAPPLSRQQKMTGQQQQRPTGFGQVSRHYADLKSHESGPK